MSEERPDDAREPDGTAGPADGDDGQEARRASGSDAPFHGLRSAADIFGAPRGEEDWPSRRERREAERTARETGAPLPEPFVPEPEDAAPAPAPAPAAPDDSTQAISMPAELLAPSENPDAAVEHERSTLHDRIPAAADVPPDSTAPHPSSIVLPTAQAHRDERAAASKAIEDERRRVDPFGEGRADVDWLGRATGSHPEPVAPAAPQPLGVENVLPPTEEPPTFTDLLRITSTGPVPTQTGAHDRPFDWAIGDDDEPGEVPATLTTDSFDTTALSAGSWSLADEFDDEDEVVAGEVDTPAAGLPQAPRTYPVPPSVPVPPAVPPAVPAAAAAGAGAAAAAGAASPDASDPADPTEAVDAPRASTGADEAEATEGLRSDAPTTAIPAAGTPWWSEPDATVPPTAAPPLVEPTAGAQEYPAHLPPSVGQDLDAVLGLGRTDTGPQPESLPAAAPDDLDQSEWDGRETSDTSAIKDLFGTEAVGQLGDTGYDPEDTGTRMMPAAAVPTAAAPAAARPAAGAGVGRSAAGPDRQPGERDNFINEGFARLRNEGKRGKQLLIYGSIALILVLIVLVFLLSKWILGNNIADQAVPTKSPSAASSASAAPTAAPSTAQSSEATAPAAALQFATTPAQPGEHPWTDLAGGECLSPFTNAWSQTFTVVDCATPHIGQLTARLAVEGDTYPGAEALATQAADQCQSDTALNASAAAAVGDVQVQGSYAPDQATWDQGDRFIACFVTRSSGQPLTGSLAPGA
ncbi:septum formation family protein [Curtobacterium poinsettiae]|uniref:septum formation family protein n=1 Tax=Curtobacterium poinsettiae TaxID=159612 RepID=UPI00217EC8CD|nr:septum formation family protein [Curtobacterium flaccumfaciens]MCS6577757.1 septum formation family protein [Curtobacterium flaccumfaciens]